MPCPSTRSPSTRSSSTLLVLSALALALALPAHGNPRPFHLRNLNPFLQVFGVPAPEGSTLTAQGQLHSDVAVSLANHADRSEFDDEAVVLDGESYYVDTRFRYGIGQRWEVGLDVPYVAHRRGTLDNLIEDWHDAFGLDNSQRQGPSNHLQLMYRRGDTTELDLRDGSGGLGDVRITGAYQLIEPAIGRWSVALRGSVELPTGDENQLRGNGATDVALGVEGQRRLHLAERALDVYGQAGALRPGESDLLADRQQRLVPYAAVGAAWHWRANLDLRVQLTYQGEYYDSHVAEIGGTTTNLTVGGAVRLPRLGVELDVGFVEDLISDATPDLGLYLAVRRVPAGAPR